MARSKKPSTTGDMIRSLLVILIPLVVIAALFTDLPRDHPVKEVDWQAVAQTARKQAEFPVLTPTSLPAGWRSTEAQWIKKGEPYLNNQPSPRNLWRLGFLTPDNVYVGLAQGDAALSDLIDQQTRKATPDGDSDLAGLTWRRMVSPDGRTRSLVRQDQGVATIVVSDLSYAGLEAYATTLTAG